MAIIIKSLAIITLHTIIFMLFTVLITTNSNAPNNRIVTILRISKYIIVSSMIIFIAGCRTMNHDKINLIVTEVGNCKLPIGFVKPNAMTASSNETLINYNKEFGLPIIEKIKNKREIMIYCFNAKVSEVYIIPHGFDHGSHLGVIRLNYDTGYLHNEEYKYKGDCTLYKAKSERNISKTLWTHNLDEVRGKL